MAEQDKLRVFTDTDDLFDNASSEKILQWVNSYAKSIEGRKGYQKKYQKQRRLLMAAAKEMLAPDELARIEEEASLRAAEELGDEDVASGEETRETLGEGDEGGEV